MDIPSIISPFDPYSPTDWKTTMINSLFNTIEDLRKEVIEKNGIIDRLLTVHEQTLKTVNELTLKQKSYVKCDSDETRISGESTLRDVLHESCTTDESRISLENTVVDVNEENITVRRKEKKEENSEKDQRTNELTGEIPIHHITEEEIYTNELPHNALWKKRTTLIVGDSMIGGIMEKRMRNTKVRSFPGALVEDLFYYIVPLLRKKPTNIIVHAGVNNTENNTASSIFSKLKKLQEFIKSNLPTCKVSFGTIIDRADKPDAQKTVVETNELMKKGKMMTIDNSRIDKYKHLGMKGLHLNQRGTALLAVNYINAMKNL